MNVVRDERGLIAGLEDDDGLVREVVRDDQGRPPAKPPASMARYFALPDQARRKMGRPNGSALHVTISSATASASAGDVARAIELLEDV